MITVWIQLKAKPEKADELKSILLKAVSKGEGMLRYEIFQQTANESCFSILETFESQELIDKYYLTSDYLEWRKQVDELIEEGQGTDYELIYSNLI